MIDLLQKRFLVIADYPNNDYAIVGSVIRHDHGQLFGNVPDFSKYPHLFRELHWWEMRDEKDMPEYVKAIQDGKILTVDKYALWAYLIPGIKPIGQNSINIFPATETEYNEYQKLKQ